MLKIYFLGLEKLILMQEEKTTSKKIVDFFSNRMLDYEFKMEIKREFLINSIIPKEGLGILAGRPKSMKSFLTLDLAYSVQNQGSDFLNQGSIDHGDVLLLALEDNKDSMALRIQGYELYANKIHPTTFVDFNCPLLTKAWKNPCLNGVQRLVIQGS
jgi:RecA-family ATPase